MNDTEYLMTKMERAFQLREGRPLTDTERQFMVAAAHGATDLCHASCDVPRMKALLKQQPALLDTAGSAALLMAACYFGTHDAVEFLLERGIREFYDAQTGLHREHKAEPVTKAFYHGNFRTLRTVFEAGVADASVITTSHVGWPANTSLLFWAVGRPIEFAEFALRYGADPDALMSGNGERGNTVLQEAVVRLVDPRASARVSDFIRIVLEHGAYYDIFSACGLDDLVNAGLQGKLITEIEHDPSLIHRPVSLYKADVTGPPLHAGLHTDFFHHDDDREVRMMAVLLDRGAEIQAQDSQGFTPLRRVTELAKSRHATIVAKAHSVAAFLLGRGADPG